jgi:hypothetical protein
MKLKIRIKLTLIEINNFEQIRQKIKIKPYSARKIKENPIE